MRQKCISLGDGVPELGDFLQATSAFAIIEMYILCACDGGGNSIVCTPECGLRRFICIDGVHLDCLDHVLMETKKKHTHTHTGEISTTNVNVLVGPLA